MMSMREAVEVVLAGREAARRVGHQFVMDDAKLQRMGFSRDQVHEIRRHALEIEDMLYHRMQLIPDSVTGSRCEPNHADR
jgi:hypothetical protein